MVKTRGKIDIAVMRDINCSECAQAVGKDGNNHASRHKCDALSPAFETQISNQRAQRHHRDKKLHARTCFGHAEQSSWRGNVDSLDMRRNAGEIEQPHAHFGSDGLQRGDEFFAERDQEKAVE